MTRIERRPPVRHRHHEDGPTLIEEVESTPLGAQEMAAARLAVNVTEALRSALIACKCQQQDLADRLNVSPGRVSQVLSDGNVRISTLGRFARALGYQARIVLDPVDPGCPELPVRPARAETPLADLRFSSGMEFIFLDTIGLEKEVGRRLFPPSAAVRATPYTPIFDEFGVKATVKYGHGLPSSGIRTSIKVKNVLA